MIIFEKMLGELSRRKDLHPWERSFSTCKKFGFSIAKYLALFLYLILCFFAIQFALFNLIILGLMIMFLGRLSEKFTTFTIKREVKYQNEELIKFLHQQDLIYKDKNIKFTSGEQGKWIEVQLPDIDEDNSRTITGSTVTKRNLTTYNREEVARAISEKSREDEN